MRRTISSLALGALLLLAMPATRSEAWVHGGHWHPWGGPHVVVGVGPAFGWWGPPAWFVAPPVVVVPPSPPPNAWYYCQSAHAYYPQVATCREPWVAVAPTPQ